MFSVNAPELHEDAEERELQCPLPVDIEPIFMTSTIQRHDGTAN